MWSKRACGARPAPATTEIRILSCSRLFVADHALLRPRRSGVRPRLQNGVVTAAAVSMEGLLIGQYDRISFALDGWDLRNQRRFSFRPSVTIATAIHWGSVWIFLQEIRGKCGCSVGGPHRFVWRILKLESVSQRLRRVVTLNAGDWSSAIHAAVLRDVIDVAEGNLTQLRFFSENDCFRWLLPILRRHAGWDGGYG